MTPEDRIKLIDRLDRSFLGLPRWAKVACKHGMSAPSCHPETGKKFESFREVIEAAADETLLTLKHDFESNEDLAPEEYPPEPEFAMPFSNNVIHKGWVTWMARILTHHKEEVTSVGVKAALHKAKDKLNIPINFPNPDPSTMVLYVHEDEEFGTYVFSYETPTPSLETE